jgi:hypothetical protein
MQVIINVSNKYDQITFKLFKKRVLRLKFHFENRLNAVFIESKSLNLNS